MWLISLAWKNMWRNRSRTLITTAAVGFATLVSLLAASLKEGIFDNLVRNLVRSYTGHVQIHLPGYQEEPLLDNALVRSADTERKIRSMAAVESLTPRIECFALVTSGMNTKGCMVLGVDPQSEQRVTALANRVISGTFTTLDSGAVIIGEGLARRLRMGVHDTLVLLGQGYHGVTAAGKFRIGALIRTGSPAFNERMVMMSLPVAQQWLAADSLITTYAVILRPRVIPEIAATDMRSMLGSRLEVLTWGNIMPDVQQHINTDSRNMRVIQWILYLLISFGILSTLLIMMVERRFEMGMLLAIGMSRWRLQSMMVVESVLTVLTGSLSGLLVSVPVVWYMNRYPLRITGETARAYERFGFEPVFPTSLDPRLFFEQALTVFIIGLVLSMYPVWTIGRLDPVRAMKK